jgi:hypothetical protein
VTSGSRPNAGKSASQPIGIPFRRMPGGASARKPGYQIRLILNYEIPLL